MKRHIPTRRQILESCIGRGLLIASVPMTSSSLFAMWQQGEKMAAKPTSTDVLGPFFKKGAPNESKLHAPSDPGFPLRVAGKVFNTRGEKVVGARVEIWHADHVGLYDLQGFRYRTKLLIEEKGEYSVDTIMPGHYDDRPAQHIHYLISAPGHRTLVTQVYFATDPWFEGDPDKNFNKRGLVSSRELVRPVTLFEQPGAPRATVGFDICLEKV